MKTEIEVLSQAIENKYLAESLNASVSKHMLDEHFTLVAANDRYYEMFGYEKEEYVGLFHNRPDFYYANDQDDWKALNEVVMDAIIHKKKRYHFIGRMRHKDGRKIWVRLVGTLIDEYVDGYQIAYCVMMDISDLMQTKLEKDVTQNQFPGLIAKYRVTKNGYEFMEGNQKFHEMFRDHINFSKDDMNESNGLEDVFGKYDILAKGKSCAFTISPVDKMGNKHYLNVNAECVDWINDDPVFLLMYNDITDLTLQKNKLEEYNRSMHKLAYSDEVTEGYNRRKFDQVAMNAISNSKPGTYSLIWLNMQKFKLINETAGVECGDTVLKYILDHIVSNLDKEEYAARLFSDNFCILMKEADFCKIENRLQEIVEDINRFNDDRERKYYLIFTAGIYNIKDITLSITAMEDRAHTARKSNNGKNSDLCKCHFYSEEIRQQLLKERDIENMMWESLRKKEFEVYLQPKYSLKDKTIYGAEALIRWNHPTLGFLPPAEFIPLFEKNGFIIELDLFVFESVCALLRKWISENRTIYPISVNMSRVHFTNTDFLDEYIRIKQKYEIPANYLEIELTETMVFENPNAFHGIIQRIHEGGFSCSMDDFGSGYSSLNMLKDLDLDTVKLDGAFFSSEKMDNEKENIIVRSIIDMTKELDMLTVAEGIETCNQMEFLSRTPCNLVQGYVISKPVPIKKFEELVAEQIDQAATATHKASAI